jgi:hypothetical protein
MVVVVLVAASKAVTPEGFAASTKVPRPSEPGVDGGVVAGGVVVVVVEVV